jgi:3-dehydroquinate synthase
MVQAVVDFLELKKWLQSSSGKHYVLCDENTYQHCYEIFCDQIGHKIKPIVIKAGEAQKEILTCQFIWQTLIDDQAGKDAVLINLGGGVISDIGGFVAATYKRGIKYANVPTSLLAMVDAASGGKTGINFQHFKNIIGVIQPAEMLVIHVPFLKTLPEQHLKNGFAEMLKHAIISGQQQTTEILESNNLAHFLNKASVLKSLAIKENIVAQDPTEQGLRKVLNFGHTIGHGIEYTANLHGFEILHGEAVALGLIAALKLSVLKLNFNSNDADVLIAFIRNNFDTPNWLHVHHADVLSAVLQDKKNSEQQIKMVLLIEIGMPVIDVICSLQEVENILSEI